jgi:4-amino-4-deoxy-L-arabinose transferase-like glycosyltransferase
MRPQQAIQRDWIEEMQMVGREHVSVRHIVRLHLIDVFRIRNRDQHVLAGNTERFAEHLLHIRNVLENFENQNGVERTIAKRKQRIDVHGRQSVRGGLAKIIEIDVACDAFPAFCAQGGAISAEAAPEIENRGSRMPACEPHERTVMLAVLRREADLIHVFAGTHNFFGIINALMAVRHRFLLAASFLYLTVSNLIWIARDTRPPFWDMADKQTAALHIYDAFANFGVRALVLIPRVTEFYPPLYQSVVAAFYALFGKTIDAAQWANLPAIALLFIATYAVGRTLLMNPLAAATAAVLVNFYPYLLWLSRETLVDYWLTAMVALAIWLLILTREFSDRTKSIAFGVICGLGMLTKWTFAFFLVLPALWMARKNWRNAGIAAGTAALVAAYWYIPAGQSLLTLYRINSAQSVTEGDPNRLTLQAIIFYVRAMEGYQLFLPLFLLFIAGSILLAKNFEREWIPVVLWIIGGWLGLMFFQNKDPRYTAPLLPAVALISAQIFQRKEVLVLLLVPLLVLQHYLVSFGVTALPPRVVLAQGVEGPLSWHWNLYTQSYFGLWGAPANEDWRIEHVLQTITRPDGSTVRLGIVPDIPRFDFLAFRFYITLRKLPVILNRVGTLDQAAIASHDYILVSEKDQGFEPGSAFTSELRNINHYVFSHPETFHVVESFTLPNGDVIRLYKVGAA